MYYNALDPLNQQMQQTDQQWQSHEMQKLSPEELFEVGIRNVCYGCVTTLIAFAIGIVICLLFGSCTTHREVTSVDQHSIHDLMQRMDSVINTRQVIRQDSSWHELIMSQFQSIREHNDTSHTFVVDTAGRVIKETLVIRTERESNSQNDRREREVLIHRLEVMDSTLNIMQQQFSHFDSLMQSKKTIIEKSVPAKLNIWQKARLWFANIVIAALATSASIWIFRRRRFWRLP